MADQHQIRWTRAEIEQVHKWRKAGWTWGAIAACNGRSLATNRTTYCRWRKGLLELSLQRTERRAAMVALAEQGVPIRQIHAQHGRGRCIQATYNLLQRYGFDAEVLAEYRKLAEAF